MTPMDKFILAFCVVLFVVTMYDTRNKRWKRRVRRATWVNFGKFGWVHGFFFARNFRTFRYKINWKLRRRLLDERLPVATRRPDIKP